MICDVCSKQKATVHLTEIINDQVTKLNLCEYCAKKKGSQMEQHFGIADLLQGLADPTEKGFAGAAAKVKCVSCGMSYDEFKKIGRLGCAQCYDAFRESLAPLLKRIHSSNTHTGKQPKGTSAPGTTAHQTAPAQIPNFAETVKPAPASKPTKTPDLSSVKPTAELMQLKQALKKAIDGEAYEEAARIRDKMRQVEAKIRKGSA